MANIITPLVALHEQNQPEDLDFDDSKDDDEPEQFVESVHCPSATRCQTVLLIDLPNEILITLFGCIAFHSELANITLSCQTLRNIIEPLLYHSLPLLTRRPVKLVHHGAGKVLLFLLSLVRRPELSHHGRILAVKRGLTTNQRPRHRAYNLELAEQKSLASAILQLNLLDPDTFISVFDARFEKALVANTTETRMPCLEKPVQLENTSRMRWRWYYFLPSQL
jgi:hypothetical protein